MKIERIDDNTVKCFLSNEELRELEITYKDFVTQSEKARELVMRIVEQATEEVGYRPPQVAMDMQIVVLPEKGMVLTFSEKLPEKFASNPSLLQYLEEMKRVLKMQSTPDPDINYFNMPLWIVLRFDDLHRIIELSQNLPSNLRIRSRLYKMNGFYYLIMEKGCASYRNYCKITLRALEYGYYLSSNDDFEGFLDEHATVMIPQKAIQKLTKC